MDKKKHVDTSVLMDALQVKEDFQDFITEHEIDLGVDHLKLALRKTLANTRLDMLEIFDKAGIRPSYGYQLINGTRKPSRDKLIQLAFGMGCDLDTTDHLLKSSNKQTLYPKVARDAIIIHGLIHNKTLYDVNVLLEIKGHQPLK